MAEKIFTNVRLGLKVDTLENWKSSSLVLKRGEVAFATVAASEGTGLTEPVVMMKIGDGEKTFSQLGFDFYAKASDVVAAAKSEASLKAFVNGVIADAGIATNEALTTLTGRVTTAEGKITTLEGKMSTAEGKITAAEGAIDALEALVGDKKVATQISEAIAALNLATTYEAKGEAAKVQTALNTYKTSNDAAVQANANAADANAKAIAAIKDGTTIDSFADVEAALDGKEASGAAAQALIDAKAYADGLAGNYDAKGAAAAAEKNAKDYAKEYADGLSGNYDAKGDAAQALVDAKAYTDSFTGGKTVSAYVGEVIANYSTTTQMNSAIATAKGDAIAHANGLNTTMDARVLALEAIDHDHSNKAELDKIADGDVAKWNAAEQNAKDYADGLDGAMDTRVKALEEKFTGNDSVADQIADAVADEATLRENADKALDERIVAITNDYLKAADKTALQDQITDNAEAISALDKLVGDDSVATQIAKETARAEGIEAGLESRLAAVEDDYLTSADKAALQNQINTIMNNPDAEGAINSINEFTQYVADHGTIADGMRTDINKNKVDIAAEVKRAGEAEAALSGRLDVLEDINHEAYVAADAALKDELEGKINLKATQTDLDNAVTRIGTAEGKITTLEGEMDAAQAAIDALEGLVGDKKVSVAIEEAIEACKEDASNKDAVVLAEITAAVAQHNADKAALEAEIAKKANDDDLAAIAKTGSTDDLVQGSMVLIFDCGTSAV